MTATDVREPAGLAPVRLLSDDPSDQPNPASPAVTSVPQVGILRRFGLPIGLVTGTVTGTVAIAPRIHDWPGAIVVLGVLLFAISVLVLGFAYTEWIGTADDGRRVAHHHVGIGGRGPKPVFTADPPAASLASTAEVRAWACRNGYRVGTRGPLPQSVLNAYAERAART